ncbi:MAG: YHYH protein [Roseibacillus sp.]
MKRFVLFSAFSLATPLAAHEHEDHNHAQPKTILDPAHFFQENLTGKVEQQQAKLADGSEVLCWVIPIKSEPVEHAMGPWCPTSVTDDKSLGGKWFFGGELVDVDGDFVKNLAQLYEDNEWNLVNDDGSIKVTDTEEAFLLAARPNVDPKYQNHCVEAPADLEIDSQTVYTIPVNPVINDQPTRLTRGGVAVAFNGVNFDPPAPTSAILAAHTIAPLDDHGGHMNPFEGYHYHAVTGSTKEVANEKGHAPLIGYVIDGFPLHAQKNAEGEVAPDLDDCGGHQHGEGSYHYHAGAPGSNQIIKAFRGSPGTVVMPNGKKQERGPRGDGPPPGAGRGGRPPRGEGGLPHQRPNGPPPGERPPHPEES